MASGEDERDRTSEDLFEDLDKFFAPIDEVEWTGEQPVQPREEPAPASGEEPVPQAPAAGGEPGTVFTPWTPEPDEWGEADAPATDRPEEEPGPFPPAPEPQGAPTIETEPAPPPGPVGEAPEPVPAAFSAESVVRVETEDFGFAPPTEPPAWLPEQGESVPMAGEPTGEMTGEDWHRLREVLGEEEPSTFLQASAPETGEVFGGSPAAAAAGAAAEEERPPLTVDDLRKAPPEYAGLPGFEQPSQEGLPLAVGQVEGPEEAILGGREDAYGREDEPGHDRVAYEAPSHEQVEAAAARMAEGMHDGLEEPPIGLVGIEDDLLVEAEEPRQTRTIRISGGDTMTGPSWEEPTSAPVTGAGRPAAGGRNLPAAVISGVVLMAAALVTLAIGSAAFAVVVGIVILLAQAELYATMQRTAGLQPATALGLLVGALLLVGAYLKGEPAMLMFLVLGLALSFFWYMAARERAREGAVRNVGATLLGLAYVPFLAGFALLMLRAPGGRTLVATVFGLTFFYDIAAFAVGSLWGRRPLARTISPKKSWEGLFGATIATLIVSAALLPSLTLFKGSLTKAIGMGVVIVVAAPLGDLAESLLKRDLGVKDMGTIVPGHGGMLDRIDSALFVAPAALYFLKFLFR